MSMFHDLWTWIKEQVDNFPECKHRRKGPGIGNVRKCLRCGRLIHS